MLKLLQKHAIVISIFLLIILPATRIFQQGSAQAISTVIIVFGIGTTILFTVYDNWQKHKAGELTNARFSLTCSDFRSHWGWQPVACVRVEKPKVRKPQLVCSRCAKHKSLPA